MREVQLGTTDLLECEACGGIWVDADTFERLCADREAQAAVLHRWAETERRPPEMKVHYRPCVRCGTMMNRLNFGKMSGTVIDVCKGHGTFLDAGELHQIVSFIQGGGLERARQRQLDDLKEEERRLRNLQMSTAQEHRAASVSWDPVDAIDIVSLLRDLTGH
jgi:Zn-finger nucleic acid-binding protein